MFIIVRWSIDLHSIELFYCSVLFCSVLLCISVYFVVQLILSRTIQDAVKNAPVVCVFCSFQKKDH